MWKLIQTALRIGNADQLQQLQGARTCRRFADTEMNQHRLHDLKADRQHRIERSHRLLKNHRDVAAAYGAHLVGRQFQQITTLKQNAAANDAASRLRQQLHDGERRHRFAATRFTDQGDHFAGTHLIGNALDRAHHAA